MPYAPHTRITLHGTLGTDTSPSEIWSTSFAVTGGAHLADDFISPSISTGLGDTLAGVLQDWWTRPASDISGLARLRGFKVAFVGTDGKYLAEPVSVSLLNSYGAGSGTAVYPFQVARVLTLDSDEWKAPTGRMFLPMPSAALGSDGRVSAGAAATAAESHATMLSEVNALDGPHEVCIASTKGTLTAVTKVRVGRVLDTMRSRRNALAEEYAIRPVSGQ